MTYAQIKQLALRQLDEDPHDMDEHSDLLNVYVNEGYQTAVVDHLKPRETYTLDTDKNGDADVSGLNIRYIVEVTDLPHGFYAWAQLDPMGDKLHTAVTHGRIRVVALVTYPDMVEGSEEPRLPGWSHAALADYACYRYLSNGNMAKQSKAQFYLQRYLMQMERIRPVAMGSVTTMKNLYAVTDARYVR